jgi:hypothetical protein
MLFAQRTACTTACLTAKTFNNLQSHMLVSLSLFFCAQHMIAKQHQLHPQAPLHISPPHGFHPPVLSLKNPFGSTSPATLLASILLSGLNLPK